MSDELKPGEEVTQPEPVEQTPAERPADEPHETVSESPAPQREDATPAPESPVGELDSRLCQLAEDLGWPKEDVDAFPSSAHLARALNAFNRRLTDGLPKPPQGDTAQHDSVETPGQKTEEPAPTAPIPGGWTPKLDPNENPELFEDLKTLHDSVLGRSSKQVNELRAQLGRIEQALGAIGKYTASNMERELDRCFAGLPNELSKVYGRSSSRALKADSPFRAKRDEFKNMMGTIAQSRINAGLEVPPIDDLFEMSKLMLHSDVLFKQQLKQAAESLEPVDDVSTKPGGRANGEAARPAHAAAVEFADRWETEHRR
jgi:hypothetical protein